MTFNITYKKEEALTAYLQGDLDINTVEDFKKHVLYEYSKDKSDIVLDFKNLDYIDSTGLGAIMVIYKELKDNNHRLKVINPKRNIEKLFRITQLDSLFEMED